MSRLDRMTVIRENLVDRYIRGELSEAEERQFEEFYLTDEWAQEELYTTMALRDGLARLDEDEASDDDGSPLGQVTRLPPQMPGRRPRVPAAPLSFAIAATAALALPLGVWIGGQHDELDQSALAALAAAPIDHVLLVETRAARASETLMKSSTDQARRLVIQVESAYTGDSPLTLKVRDVVSSDTVAEVTGLKLDDYGRVAVSVPGLEVGRYRVELIADDSVVTSFPLEAI